MSFGDRSESTNGDVFSIRSINDGIPLLEIQSLIESYGMDSFGDIEAAMSENGCEVIVEVQINGKPGVCGIGTPFYAWSENYIYFMTYHVDWLGGFSYHLDWAPRRPIVGEVPVIKGLNNIQGG